MTNLIPSSPAGQGRSGTGWAFAHRHRLDGSTDWKRTALLLAGLLVLAAAIILAIRATKRQGAWARTPAEELIVEMLDEEGNYRDDIAIALGKLGQEGLKAIDECLDHPERDYEYYHLVCVRALKHFSDPGRFPILKRVLSSSKSLKLRQEALSVVYTLKDAEAAAPLILVALDDEHHFVKWRAVDAARLYQVKAAIPKLEALLKMEKYRDDPNLEEHVRPALQYLYDLD